MIQNEAKPVDTDLLETQWAWKCVDAFHTLMKSKQTITADDFREAMIEQDCPARLIASNSPKLFKQYVSQRYLRKEKTYVLSEHGSRPLPQYTSLKYGKL